MSNFTQEHLAGRVDFRQFYASEGVVFKGTRALCPFHDDKKPSFDVDFGTGLFLCRACGVGGDSVTFLEKRRGLSDAEAIAELSRRYGVNGGSAPAAKRAIGKRDFEIRDAGGTLVAIHPRTDFDDGSKGFSWLRPDGSPGLGGTPVADLPLYGSERVADWPTADVVIVTEGEKKADALTTQGFRAVATVTGAGGTPSPAVLEVLRGRDVVLWPDHDKPGREHMARIGRALSGIAAQVRILSWGTQAGDDAADFFSRGGTPDQLDQLLADARTADEEDSRPSQPQSATPQPPDWISPADVLIQSPEPVYRVPTPWLRMNQVLGGGVPAGGVTTFMGMPDAGKTSICANIVMPHVLAGRATALFLCPDGGRKRLSTIIGQNLGFSRGLLLERDQATLAKYRDTVNGLPIWIPDPRRPENSVASAFEKALARMPASLWRVFVLDSVTQADFLLNSESDYDRLGRLMSFLEAFAEEHNLVVLATSQWNRSAFKNRDPKDNTKGIAGGTGSGKIEYCSANIFSITVDQGSGIRTVAVEKDKDGDEGAGTQFYLKHDRARASFLEASEDDARAVVEEAREIAVREAMARTCRALRRMRDQGIGEYPPSTAALIKAVGGNKGTGKTARERLEREGTVRSESRGQSVVWFLVEGS